MKYRISLFIVGVLTLFLVGLVSAQDNGNGNHGQGNGNGRGNNGDIGVLSNGNLDPNYRQQFLSEGSTVINFAGEGEVSILALCDAITLNRSSNLFAYNGTTHDAYSTVRDYVNPSYPCDIARVGARARIWGPSGSLFVDTTMLYSYNSADQKATANSQSNICGFANILGRGNHEFQQGFSNYSYVTEDSSC